MDFRINSSPAWAGSIYEPASGWEFGCFQSSALLFGLCAWMVSLGLLYHTRSRYHAVEKYTILGQAAVILLGLSFLAYENIIQHGRPTPLRDLAPSSTSNEHSPFTLLDDANEGATLLPNVQDPEAVNPQNVCPGYVASNVQATSHGFTADLDLAGTACNVYGTDVAELSLIFEYQASDRIHLEILPRYIGPRNYTWFVLPEELIPKPVAAEAGGNADTLDNEFEFMWDNSPTFAFTVLRKLTGDVLFSTNGSKLVFEDQFFEFGSPLPENYNLYGLGEVIHSFRLGNNLTRTLFTADVGDNIDANIYGFHPVYIDTRYFELNPDNEAIYAANATNTSAKYESYTHGVFLRNAHAQEVLLRESNITWRGLGGTIDLYFYAGPTAEKVMKSYQHSTIGLPAMQQYWALGYHQCRWGYTGWETLQEVVDDFARSEIPLETIWADIDYMYQYRDFTGNQKNWSYTEAAKFLSRLHENGQHFVPIVDSAIYAPDPKNSSDIYPTYDRGIEANAFILNPDGSLYVGEVWPGSTVFPDFIGAVLNTSRTFEWWTGELSTWHANIPYDGIWIDMSEAASFCIGSCGTRSQTIDLAHPPLLPHGELRDRASSYPESFSSILASKIATTAPASSTATTTSYLRTTPTPGIRNVNYPPYVIQHFRGDLAVKAVSLNATHHGGTQEYDFHNLFGHQILNATYNALLSVFPGTRPFIIGRSTFAGSGKYAGHWGGDNYSLWAFMFFSIPQALSFSIFGFPMFGVDTCGLDGNVDMELCARWMQLSAFFPFYRNHNNFGRRSQEPYRWPEVAEASRVAMRIRYTLLPYMYTALYKAHTQGETVMRALAWEFPGEPWLAAADRQFLLGDAIMVTPCLVQGATSVNGVFPGVGVGTVWYDWYNQSAITGVGSGENVTIAAPLGHIPVYIRGGHVIPTQEPGMTTKASRANPWGLLVALDGRGQAVGSLYVDDGVSLVPKETLTIELSAANGSLTALPSGKYKDSNPLANITIMGIQRAVSEVVLNGQVLLGKSWGWDARTLSITGLQNSSLDDAWGRAWTLTWK